MELKQIEYSWLCSRADLSSFFLGKVDLRQFDEGPIKIECNQQIHVHSSQQPNETHQKAKDT